MRKICKTVLVAALGAIAFVPTAHATLVYSTSFSAPPYTDAVLNVGTDTTTPGQDGWITSSGGGMNNMVVSNTATNGFVSLTTSGQDVRRLFDGGAAAAVGSGSVFLAADITVSAAQATGDYALHLTDGGTSNFYSRTYIKSSGAGFVMALGTSSGTPVTYGTTVLNFGTTYHVLDRYDFIPGPANDTGALYINPVTADGGGDTAYVPATTTGTDATSIDAVALRQGTGSSAATLTVDNIQVITVPEPASVALLGIAAVGLFRRRRPAIA
jgi:hypothetical protein